jgi:pantoate--beta-alanine ligase
MRVIRSAHATAAWSEALRREGVIIGLVPTMGALHEGHRSLIRAARLACDAVVVSVFVNPKQFGPGEDLAQYPRSFRADTKLCRTEGVDILFAPSVETMYPPGFGTVVALPNLSQRWEGKHRPRHFDGVATVVTKLLSLVRPAKVFFGRKDFQQALLVRRLVANLNLGVSVVVCPTKREPDGLAMSSRNAYLTAAQCRTAPVLYRALGAGAATLRAGHRSAAFIRRAMIKTIRSEPSVRVDYLAVCDPETLEPLTRVRSRAVLLGAIRIGAIRLIDNLVVRVPRR